MKFMDWPLVEGRQAWREWRQMQEDRAMNEITYKGFKITTRPPKENEILCRVDIFDPEFRRLPPLYKTTSLDLAMKWVDAYQKGEQWTVAR